jgi:hypothetical protein
MGGKGGEGLARRKGVCRAEGLRTVVGVGSVGFLEKGGQEDGCGSGRLTHDRYALLKGPPHPGLPGIDLEGVGGERVFEWRGM